MMATVVACHRRDLLLSKMFSSPVRLWWSAPPALRQRRLPLLDLSFNPR
jgi:hypothetical protein